MAMEVLTMLGTMDYIVLGSMAGLLVYWFGVRSKKDESMASFRHTPKSGPSVNDGAMADTSFVAKMKNSGRNMISFYGSQTGTAEDYAIRLSKDTVRYGMEKGMAADPEEFEMSDLTRLAKEIERPLVVFCVATYGEGDPTDNALDLYDWLKDNDEDDNCLEGLNYAVFALGNRTYEQFNAMGKFVDTRLANMGAKRVFNIGLGDDDGNIEDDFVAWRDEFWPAVCVHFGIKDIGDEIRMRQFALTTHEPQSVNKSKIYVGEPSRINSLVAQKMPFDAKNPYLAPISVNRELHNGGDRSCMHIEFDISGSRLRYDAGDHLGVFARNDSNLVNRIGELLEIDLDTVFTLRNVDEDASKHFPFPCPTTYRTALTHYVDITAPPRANMLKELLITDGVNNIKDEGDRLKYEQMFIGKLPEDKEMYNEFVMVSHRTIVALLEDIKSFRPPIDHICEVLPKLQPRYYSISSSPKLNNDTVHVTAVLVDWTTKTDRPQKGVATTFLKNKAIGNTAPIYIRKSQFRLPFKNTVPVIMIGPGTGIAPFRGFIQDRSKSLSEGKKIGDMLLYFGCRHENEDYIYQEELDNYVKEGVISKLRTAFSRDQKDKIYVQHLMKEDMDLLWTMINAGAHIYVCGDAKHMAHDVDAILLEVVTSKGGLTQSAGVDYLKRLRSRGRYSCDIWS